jgi:hypothetical protein
MMSALGNNVSRNFLAPALLLALVLAQPALPAEPEAGASAAASQPAAEALPSTAELEAAGARIGNIVIIVDDVFEARPGKEWNALYRLANRLHPTTDLDTIAPQLLFKTGDIYDPAALEETARILRSRRYLNAARVTPVRHNADNTVDVEVRVHDVWTLSPGFSYGRKGGVSHSSVEIKDTNLFGWGKAVAFSRDSNVDRTSWLFNYNDPNLLGSWWNLALEFADSSDGHLHGISVGRPFYSLQTPWSVGFAGSDGFSTQSRYDRGEIVDQFEADRRVLGLNGGVKRETRAGWVSRYLGGFHYERNDFSPTALPLVGELPSDRTLSFPWAGIEWLEDNYRTTMNLNQIGRTEDLHLGRSLRFSVGVADRAFGADRTAVMLGGLAGAGVALGKDRYLLGDLTYTTRVEQGELTNSRFGAIASFYLRHSDWSVFYAGLKSELGTRLDRDQQVLLGGDNGLRGYPLRFQAGSARALVTLEERFYTKWRPFELLQVGAAVFFDAGQVWGDDPVAGAPLGILKDVGFGLRFGSLRSGLGNVIHVDIAYPLDRTPGMDGMDGMQVIVETKRSF